AALRGPGPAGATCDDGCDDGEDGGGGVFSTSRAYGPPFGVRCGAWVCLRALSGTPWKSRIVRDRANPVRLLPPESGPWKTTPALPPGGGRRMSGDVCAGHGGFGTPGGARAVSPVRVTGLSTARALSTDYGQGPRLP